MQFLTFFGERDGAQHSLEVRIEEHFREGLRLVLLLRNLATGVESIQTVSQQESKAEVLEKLQGLLG